MTRLFAQIENLLECCNELEDVIQLAYYFEAFVKWMQLVSDTQGYCTEGILFLIINDNKIF